MASMADGSSIIATTCSPGPTARDGEPRPKKCRHVPDSSHRNIARKWSARSMLRLTSAAVALIAATLPPHGRPLVWNATASVDVGLYWITKRKPGLRDIAAVQLPAGPAGLASARGYLPKHALLLKPVAAARGDWVCRLGKLIVINSKLRAYVLGRDLKYRPMPVWHGCRALRDGQVLVLSSSVNSFDSRYFGILDAQDVRGTALPLLTY